MDNQDYIAFITNDTQEAKKLSSMIGEYSHIYLIGKNPNKNQPNITPLNFTEEDDIISFLSFDIVNRRLSRIWACEKLRSLKSKVDLHIFNRRQFDLIAGPRQMKNFWANLPIIMDSPNSSILTDAFSNKPVVLVSSGPSLNKNIDFLKVYQGKIIVMACGSAIGALKKHNITPEFVVNIDPSSIMKDVILPYADEKTILIADALSSNELLKEWPGEKIIFYRTEAAKNILKDLFAELNITCTHKFHVTVTTAALALAIHGGANPVIFVGQDMCIYDDSFYAEGVNSKPDNKTCIIKGIDGKDYITTPAYKEVLYYLNNVVPYISECKIINATEGGTGIKGAEVMTLEDCLKQYVKQPLEITFKKIIPVTKIALVAKALKAKAELENLLITNFENIRDCPGYQYISLMADWILFQNEPKGHEYLKKYIAFILEEIKGFLETEGYHARSNQ